LTKIQIENLEKRITQLEKELKKLQEQNEKIIKEGLNKLNIFSNDNVKIKTK